MTKISEALTYGLTVRESANDGSDFTNPATDYRRLFLGEDGQLHAKDSAGTVTNIGAALTIAEEGTPLATAATSLDFVGAGVVASGAGAAKTITIAGGGGGGSPADAAASLITAYGLFR